MKKPAKTRAKKPARKRAARKKPSLRCAKCGAKNMDRGQIRVGPLYRALGFGYRSDSHSPYADHVSHSHAHICMKCGYTEIFFDVSDLKRKVRAK